MTRLLESILEDSRISRPFDVGAVGNLPRVRRRTGRHRRYSLSAGRVANLWVIVSHLQSFDGSPMYVSKSTRGSAYGGVPNWVSSPREAKRFNSRQAANQFYKRCDFESEYHAFPINLARYGFAG